MKQLMGSMDPKQCIAMLMILIEDRAKGDEDDGNDRYFMTKT